MKYHCWFDNGSGYFEGPYIEEHANYETAYKNNDVGYGAYISETNESPNHRKGNKMTILILNHLHFPTQFNKDTPLDQFNLSFIRYEHRELVESISIVIVISKTHFRVLKHRMGPIPTNLPIDELPAFLRVSLL